MGGGSGWSQGRYADPFLISLGPSASCRCCEIFWAILPKRHKCGYYNVCKRNSLFRIIKKSALCATWNFNLSFVHPGFLSQDDVNVIVYNILTASSRICFTMMKINLIYVKHFEFPCYSGVLTASPLPSLGWWFRLGELVLRGDPLLLWRSLKFFPGVLKSPLRKLRQLDSRNISLCALVHYYDKLLSGYCDFAVHHSPASGVQAPFCTFSLLKYFI